ncbi:MAG: regulatory protein RecX [Candidatus Levyibacteriota bacterium]|nr:MAG: regulatory protein RecX [Candidatus Levybacteria bacterium]
MDEFEKYYNHALRFLSFRPRSEKEIRDNLKKKKVDPLVIEKIIIKLKEQKFVNDKDFARMWVESRMRFKPRSQRFIILELKNKGIVQDIIDSIIQNNDLEQAKKLVVKKIEKYQELPKNKLYQKLGSFLARRGFSWETIKESIDEVVNKEV